MGTVTEITAAKAKAGEGSHPPKLRVRIREMELISLYFGVIRYVEYFGTVIAVERDDRGQLLYEVLAERPNGSTFIWYYFYGTDFEFVDPPKTEDVVVKFERA